MTGYHGLTAYGLESVINDLRAAGYVVTRRDTLADHITATIRADALIARTPGEIYQAARETAERAIQSAEDHT